MPRIVQKLIWVAPALVGNGELRDGRPHSPFALTLLVTCQSLYKLPERCISFSAELVFGAIAAKRALSHDDSNNLQVARQSEATRMDASGVSSEGES